ncbi:unnamed protein product [Lampetra planeri]
MVGTGKTGTREDRQLGSRLPAHGDGELVGLLGAAGGCWNQLEVTRRSSLPFTGDDSARLVGARTAPVPEGYTWRGLVARGGAFHKGGEA